LGRPTERRSALGEYRVGQPEFAAHFQQHGGMPQAEHTVVGGGRQLFAGQRMYRNLPHRPRAARLVKQHLPENAQGSAEAGALYGSMVTEGALLLFGSFAYHRRGIETG